MNGLQVANADGSSQTVNGQIGLSSFGTAYWYEGNVQSCANKGMRLPTVYETRTTDTSDGIYPTDASPTFAEANGVPSIPSAPASWTASATSNDSFNGWVWSGTGVSVHAIFFTDSVRCVLP